MCGHSEPRLLAMGDTAWTVELGAHIDVDVNARCMGLAQTITDWAASGEGQGVVDVVPTFRSVTVHYDPRAVDGTQLGDALLRMAKVSKPLQSASRTWRLPACFDGEFAPDLDAVATRLDLDVAAVIETFLAAELRVHAMGFMPGFAYMASLPERLSVPRLKVPRTHVPSQSLAIAGTMVAVYPWVSPGGWNLIGYAPVIPFSLLDADEPALFRAGDVVQFYRVSADACVAIAQEQKRDIKARRRYLVDASL